MDHREAKEHDTQDRTTNNEAMELTSNMEERAWMQYADTLVGIHYPEHTFNGSARVSGGKLIVAVTEGIVIFPEDMSYKQFISNTWYD